MQNEDGTDVPEVFETGSFVVLQLNSRKFVGLITDMDSDNQEADVSILRPPLPADIFHWPKNLVNMAIPMPHILSQVELSEIPDNRYTLTEADRQKLIKKRYIRPKK